MEEHDRKEETKVRKKEREIMKEGEKGQKERKEKEERRKTNNRGRKKEFTLDQKQARLSDVTYYSPFNNRTQYALFHNVTH